MNYSYSKITLWGALALAALAGCHRQQSDEPPAHPGAEGEEEPTAQTEATEAQQSGATGTTGTPGATATADPDLLVITITAVDIDTKLAQLCGIPGSSVFFKFDSAKLQPAAKERLQQIAVCATTGAAKGQKLVVVGRTDPTGSDQYNKQLGMSRADAVTKYLRDQGVSGARVDTESKGEAGAMAEPFGWPLERRVTVRLQP